MSVIAPVLMLGAGAAHAQNGPFVYVPNVNSNTVIAIDTATNTTTLPIAVGGGPATIAVRGDESLVYVTNSGQGGLGSPNTNTVSVINTATNSVIANINVGNNPEGVAVSPDGTRLYVANYNDNTVSVINTATNTVVTTISASIGIQPVELAVSPGGTLVYVTNTGSNTVSVINTATNTVTATINVGANPQGVTFSPDGTHAYVANFSSNTVTVIDTATNTVVSTISVGTNPSGTAVSPNGAHAYVANNLSNTVSVIDTATNTVIATIPVGTGARAPVFSPDGSRAYVTNEFSGNVSVIDTATNTVIATVPVGTLPLFPGICSNGNALLAAGLTFKANTSGALACTLASGPTGAAGPVFTGGTLQFAAAGISSALPITLMSQGGTFDTAGNNATLSGTIGGAGGLTKIGAGILTLSGAGTYSGPTFVNAGTLKAGIVNAFSPNSTYAIASGAALDLNGFNQVIGGLTGTGSVINSSVIVPALTIASGGTLAPGDGTAGTSLTIASNLAFQSGAIYLVQINPTTASLANVTGTATLAGATVNAVFAAGSYVSKRYTILTAAGGVSGTFSGINNTNLPAGFTDALSYDGTDVFLNLTATLGLGGGLNRNQQNVATSINNAFNAGVALPPGFVGLFGLTGTALANALTQASGELATGSQQTTFDAMNLFLGLLTDPFMGRGSGIGGSMSATAYAEDRRRSDAYAMFTKAPPAPFVQRWSVWAAGYGGSQSTRGDAILGSNDATSRIFGTAVGADYLFSPDTLAGFALAGGGTSFGVNNLGSGRSDLFQAGAYFRHTHGPAYLTGALAYGWQDITTDRNVTIAGLDHLRAAFNANAWSGRVEGGYRFAISGFGLTPYAAGQFVTFDLPAYTEQATVGANTFALAYNAKSVTDSRSELGGRADKSFVMPNGIFTLRGRLAWAHDFNPDRNVLATFQTLPGASFVVNGALHAANSALATASAEWKWLNGWSAAATFEGEFANVARSYAGKGVVRYAW